jgi:hypothetical protein
MDNVIEVVALLRKHSELEMQIPNGHGLTSLRRGESATRREMLPLIPVPDRTGKSP